MATVRRKSTHQSLPTAPRTSSLADMDATISRRHTLDMHNFPNPLLEATYYKKKAIKYRSKARFQTLLLVGLAVLLATSWILNWKGYAPRDDFVEYAKEKKVPGAQALHEKLLHLPDVLKQTPLAAHIRDGKRFHVLDGAGPNVTLVHFGWTLRDASDALNLRKEFENEVRGEGVNAAGNRRDVEAYVDEVLVRPWKETGDGRLCGKEGVFERAICDYAVKRFGWATREFLGRSGWGWGWGR